MLHKRMVWTVAIAMLALFQGTARAQLALTFTGGLQGGITGNGDSNGWRFTANQAVVVDALGLWDQGANGLVQSHDVGLYTDAGALVASTTVLAGTVEALVGDFRMAAITPVTLSAGATYRIAAFYRDGADPFIAALATATTISQISYLDRAYQLNSGALVFPAGTNTNSLDANFGPNFTVKPNAAVPEPSSLALLALGVGVMALPRLSMRRRTSAAQRYAA